MAEDLDQESFVGAQPQEPVSIDFEDVDEVAVEEEEENGDDGSGRENEHFVLENNDDPESDNEDGDAELEEVEPSYEYVGEIKFHRLVHSLERVSQHSARGSKKSWTNKKKVETLIPPKLLKVLQEHEPGKAPESIYPVFRLLCPKDDGARRCWTKEKKLAAAYKQAFGFAPSRTEARMLDYFQDPSIAGAKAGDFADVLEQVLKGNNPKRPRVSLEESKVTVQQLNKALDDLAKISNKSLQRSNHDFRKRKRDKNAPKEADLRAEWVRLFLNGGPLRMPPVEHKWLARIVLDDMKVGVGLNQILPHIHELGPQIWATNSSMVSLCRMLCQPKMANLKKQTKSGGASLVCAPYFPVQAMGVVLGNNFIPMLSNKTSFLKMLTDISGRHQSEKKTLEKDGNTSPALCSLAMTHPAFTIETKLDGERMLIHYSHKEGKVRMHTRWGVWYSNQYAPCVGPAIRRAIAHWNMDIILDGEMMAWDDGNKETICFGNNRTVAKLRTEWMRNGELLDDRDKGLHDGNMEIKEGNPLYLNFGNDGNQLQELGGASCWLQYVAFDVVYVNGPNSEEFLGATTGLVPPPKPGSILDLEGFDRKKILYRLVKEQENEVEIVATKVVSCDGRHYDGKRYFSFHNPQVHPESGHPLHTLDSIGRAFRGDIADLADIDSNRRGSQSDKEISLARARQVDVSYQETVEDRKLEGLMFKDLNTNYVCDVSRALSGWFKFKPDYFNGAAASDLDLVIVGAYYATGLRMRGQPSSFLCACRDSNNDNKFLPFCKVNGQSMATKNLKEFLAFTGEKWFRSEVYPDYFTLQNPGEAPWKLTKKDLPDKWIEPQDSLVVVVNAGEIVESTAFPTKITLRFPRITRLRSDKPSYDIESIENLTNKFLEVNEARAQKNANAPTAISGNDENVAPRRFLTESEFLQQKKAAGKRKRTVLAVSKASKPKTTKSDALEGLRFCTLLGSYSLKNSDVASSGGDSPGWIASAEQVKSHLHVQAFIQDHSGTVVVVPKSDCFVLGGSRTDASVGRHMEGINSAYHQPKPTGKNPTKISLKLEKMADQKGVLRWTFPFELVEKWSSQSLEGPLLKCKPELAEPGTLDYLTQPDFIDRMEQLRDLGHMNSCFEMSRALELAQRNNADTARGEQQPNDWFHTAGAMEPSDRWLLLSDGTTQFWPSQAESSTSVPHRLVVYPDIFPDSGHLDEAAPDRLGDALGNCDKIQSLLPLLRVSGALVNSHLRSQTTHVLCELRAGMAVVEGKNAKVEDFSDYERGKIILDRLDLLDKPDILIVSPSWVRNCCQQRWE